MDGEIIVGYVRGTCHTSKASFLLQLYLLNLIRPRKGEGGGGEGFDRKR